MSLSDAQIQRRVLDELAWDLRVDPTEVGVEVDAGAVTLTGTVSSYGKKLAAAEAAHRVNGVLDVANDLQIKLPGSLSRTDTDIAHAIRLALEWDVLVAHQKIRTTVTDGWVRLEGEIPLLADRAEVERVVRNIAGVKGITDLMQVSVHQTDPVQVRHAIQEALDRQADREAARITVDVKDGVILLSGPVHSWRERQAVLNAAQHAPGVHALEDHLRMETLV